MLKYYKEFLSQYEYASLLQTLILIGFMAIFITVFVKVMKKRVITIKKGLVVSDSKDGDSDED